MLQALIQQADRHPSYGYGRLTRLLRRHKPWGSLTSNRVRRLMQAAGIAVKRRKKPRRTTHWQHGFRRYPNRVLDRVVNRPDQSLP